MYQEVLKFGAQIVDALVEYNSPVFVYIPPGGELRIRKYLLVKDSKEQEKRRVKESKPFYFLIVLQVVS